MEEPRKIASVAIEQSKKQKKVILEAQREKRKVHFATLMDICHPKNVELTRCENQRTKNTKDESCSEVTL